MKSIEITDVIVEEGDYFEISYIPDQTQILHEGEEYVFVFNNGNMELKKK